MYRQHQDGSAASEQQFQFSASSSNFSYSPFGSGISSVVDQGFHSSPHHLTPRSAVQQQPGHRRHQSADSQLYATSGPRGSLSPRLGTPVRNASSSYTPKDRALPSREVTADTITDAYVAFILYCNPSFSLDTDTTTLRTNFETPPKSDNKDFETYRLFELIQKFDSKEIKTWGQLALELGVEAPDTSKGQSVQKVQQYSVRLKRWMRAMHVDAFFEYLLGKQHAYYNDVPHPDDPYPSGGRDGVAAEEDLAIRALNPAFRPKRGRRRNSEAEQDEVDETESVSKQSKLADDTSQGFANAANTVGIMPFNTNADNSNDPWAIASAVTPNSFAPWMQRSAAPQTAITSSAPSHLRWQLHGRSQNPNTPHPMTAHPTSMAEHIEAAFDNEPKSAITPSVRKRRKHGPAVSSAWPSSNAPGAKPRGRPPASRNVQDGPFSTFPADPANEKSGGIAFAAPVAPMEIKATTEEQPAAPQRPPIVSRQSDGAGRPGRLSLQVPPHTGGPVRLATPPRVLVNGETNDDDRPTTVEPLVESPNQMSAAPPRRVAVQPQERDVPGFAFEALKRVLASDLLRADLVGRRSRLNGDEAKRLADAVLDRFNIPREDTDNSKDDLSRLTAASWLGVGEQLNVPLGPATSHNKRIVVTRFRLGADGYEEIAPTYDDSPGYIREVYDLSWIVSMGGCHGNFELKGLSISDPTPKDPDLHDQLLDTWSETARQVGIEEDDIGRLQQRVRGPTSTFPSGGAVGADGIDWKSRYHALEFGAKMAKGELERYRHRVIEKLLDTLM